MRSEPRPDAKARTLGPFLRNGSALSCPVPQVLELEQHGKGSLQLAVEVDLIARQTLQALRIKRLAQRLGAQQGPAFQLLAPLLVPGQDLPLEKASQTRWIRAERLLILPVLRFRKRALPPRAGIFAHDGKGLFVSPIL